MLLNEYGYSYTHIMSGGPTVVTVPYAFALNGKWWFWFNKDGYRGINAKEIVWGDRFTMTLQPKEKNPDLPKVTVKGTYMAVEVES